MKKKFGALLVLAIGMMIAATGCGAEKVTLNDYVTNEIVGYDGYGYIASTIDYDALVEDVFLKADDNKNLSEEDVRVIVDEMVADHTLKVACEEDGSLSNGDKATVAWNLTDKDIEVFEKKTGVQLSADADKVAVDGLDDIDNFDILNYLNITVDGFAPAGEIFVTGSEVLTCWPEVLVDKSSGLSNGDVVTISIGHEKSEFEEFLRVNYLPVMDKEITYTVEGLPSYVQSVDQLSDEYINALISNPNTTKNLGWLDEDGGNHQYSGGKSDVYAIGLSTSIKNIRGNYQNIVLIIYKTKDTGKYCYLYHYNALEGEEVTQDYSISYGGCDYTSIEDLKAQVSRTFEDIQIKEL